MRETQWYGSFEEMRQHNRQGNGKSPATVFEPKIAAQSDQKAKPKTSAKGKASKKEAKKDE